MQHKVVSQSEWLRAREALLLQEKEFTRARDELSRLRRELPWTKVDKSYVFEGADGKRTLAELFDGRSQLVVYHFMFGPDWNAGCPHCSRWADNFNSIIVHLNQRDVTMIAVSRAPYAKLAAYRKRMGWTFNWVSSHESDFNFDYHVSFTPDEIDGEPRRCTISNSQDPDASEREGVSIFFKDDAGHIHFTPIPRTPAASTC